MSMGDYLAAARAQAESDRRAHGKRPARAVLVQVYGRVHGGLVTHKQLQAFKNSLTGRERNQIIETYGKTYNEKGSG
jgi:hypothetical protein